MKNYRKLFYVAATIIAVIIMLVAPTILLAQQEYCIQDQSGVGYTQCESQVYGAIARGASQQNMSDENFWQDTAHDLDWNIRTYNIGQQLNGGPTVREHNFQSMTPEEIFWHPAMNNNYIYGEVGYTPPDQVNK